jgi:hypothetical protein
LLKVCCGQASKADALGLKAALAEMGYAAWDDIEVVPNVCEIRDPPEQTRSPEGQGDNRP